MRSAVALMLVAVALVLQPGSSPAGSQAINGACSSKFKAGPELGHVTVEHSDVFFGGGLNKLAHTGNPISSGGAICTAGEGDAVLNLNWGGKGKCELGPLAAVKLTAAKKKRFIRVKLMGDYDFDFWCFRNQLDVDHQRIKLRAELDPLFWVSRRGTSLTVKIARGFLQVSRQAPSGSAPATPVIVGPNEQTVARGDGGPSQPQSVVRGGLARLFAFGATVRQLPTLFSRPSEKRAKRSPALKRIRRRNTIIVGFQGGDVRRSAAGRFVERYFGFLADKWGVRTTFRAVRTLARARSQLKGNQIDVFVGEKAPARTLTAPFFSARGRKWLLVVNLDPVFLDSLTTFLQSALDRGNYGAIYNRALPQLPVYKTVAPLIFPHVVCTPAPQADLTSELDLALRMKSAPSGPLRRGARVVQTATVENIGNRVVDCVTLHLHIFGGTPLNWTELERRGCESVAQTAAKEQTGELELSCELGRFGLMRSKSLRVVVRPSSGAPVHTETCVNVDADESGGLPETKRGDNGDCTALVYRTTSLAVAAAEDQVKDPDPATSRRRLRLVDAAGLDAVVFSEPWQPGKTAPGPQEKAELKNVVDAADSLGVELYLAVYNLGAKNAPVDPPVTAEQQADFTSYLAALARAAPEIRHFVVGNEPNSNRFWPDQYTPKGRSDKAAVDYERLLAASYDALKAVDENIVVIGGALAPRSREGRESHSPTEFIIGLGAAYRASHRDLPIMDAFALHPIPSDPRTAPRTAHASTSTELGIADYPLLVSLLGRAFDGTAQPGSTIPIYYTEYAIQSIIPASKLHLYDGQMQSLAVDVGTQALFYRQAIALASCQQTVDGIFFFHVFDQKSLERWQSGLFYANESPKKTARAVRKAALAARKSTVSSCPPSVGVP